MMSTPDIKFTELFINNEFVPAKSGLKFASIDPGTENVIAEVHEAGREDVDAAVRAAHNAFQTGSEWRRLTPNARGALLNKLADLIDENKDYFAALEAWDSGKPVKMAEWVDMATAAKLLRYYAGWPDKLTGRTYSNTYATTGLTYSVLEPVGVVAAILPFNFPLMGIVSKVAPALAAGCCCVVKPAEHTPLGALYFASLVREAGFPAGTFNVVNGPGATTGEYLTTHPLVRKITFTGSTNVGKHIQKVAADTMKHVTFELGGKNACIILEDADVETAVKIASGGNYFNSGQICVGISRVFIPDSMYDEFVQKAVEKASKRTIGDQWSGADQGPQNSRMQFERVLRYIDIGVKEGAELMCGGKAAMVREDGKGFYIEPTIFANVTDDMTIAKEEIFGPVMCCMRYSSLSEVVERANNTNYGLAATIISNNMNKALSLANVLETGTVWINGHGIFDTPAPYGGRKQSGIGREYGEEGILDYVEKKTVFVVLPDEPL